MDDRVQAVLPWDPDGGGPAGQVLAVAGAFLATPGGPASRIAIFDPAIGAWSSLGSGVDGEVWALAVASDGSLVAGGYFTVAGGVAASRVARWDGNSWSALGAGVSGGVVKSLATLPTGELIAGGTFTQAGAGAASGIAKWDGSGWSAIGMLSAGSSAVQVNALAVSPNGDLIVGGLFTSVNGVSMAHIARWNGAIWSPLGAGRSWSVHAVACLPNGMVVAGGDFTDPNAPYLALWTGAVWAPLGGGVSTGTNFGVRAVHVLANGHLMVGGYFNSAGGVFTPHLARWDGFTWSSFNGGTPNAAVVAMTELANGDVVVGGHFSTAGQTLARRLARWTGNAWAAYSAASGLNGHVFALAELANGDVLVGGGFTTANGNSVNHVAIWTGTSWLPLSTGVNGWVHAALPLANGDIVVGGQFTSAGGVPVNRVARWNGSSWSPLGSGLDGPVRALAGLPNGDLVAGGIFDFAGGVATSKLARWDGVAWSPVGGGVSGGFGGAQTSVDALTVLQDGSLVVGGSFTVAGGSSVTGVARFDGSSWHGYGAGLGLVTSLHATSDGRFFAGIYGLSVFEWNGTSWVHVGGGLNSGIGGDAVHAIVSLPDGDVVVGGFFPLPALTNIARWDAVWSGFGIGVDGRVRALAATRQGHVIVGGEFTTAGGVPSAYVARLVPTCPASAVSFAPGCSGSAGTVVLSALTLPWTGGAFRGAATGIPAGALALTVYGFGQLAIPMPALFPQGTPGCTLWTTPDSLTLQLPLAGAVDTSLSIPANVALVGVIVYHQVVPVELDLAGSITAVTTSNQLRLSVGAF